MKIENSCAPAEGAKTSTNATWKEHSTLWTWALKGYYFYANISACSGSYKKKITSHCIELQGNWKPLVLRLDCIWESWRWKEGYIIQDWLGKTIFMGCRIKGKGRSLGRCFAFWFLILWRGKDGATRWIRHHWSAARYICFVWRQPGGEIKQAGDYMGLELRRKMQTRLVISLEVVVGAEEKWIDWKINQKKYDNVKWRC